MFDTRKPFGNLVEDIPISLLLRAYASSTWKILLLAHALVCYDLYLSLVYSPVGLKLPGLQRR